MKLCIAEKPSVAREIASILGANSKKNGYFEGNGYFVSWTFGHLCTLKEPRDYLEEWKGWQLNSLPMIPSKFGIKLKDDQGIKKQFEVIASLIKQCDEVVNCGDAGQEGEVIQRWVLLKARNDKPVKRLWISSLTEDAIKEGFEKLMEGDDFNNLYAAGSSRAIGDWLLGINATRLFTLIHGKEKLLSVGRVQTPTLAMIVERHKEIENFVSQKYWELKTVYRDTEFSASEGRFEEKEKAEQKIQEIKTSEFTITSFEKKKGKEQPPRLFDLTSLQVECNKKLAMSAEETLNAVQSLYEKKAVTYPRVDTTFLPNDMYPKIKGIMEKMSPYSDLTASVLGGKIPKPTKVFNDKKVTDHHAIVPTGIVPSGATYQEKKVYHIIALRFIAAFYPECKISRTTVLGEAAAIEFRATGKQILDPGWRVVFQKEQKDEEEEAKEKEEEQLMPAFEKGEKGPHEPQIHEKETRPPKHYTEATLLRAMETAGKQVDDDELRDLMKENGIGRPSTRANIIETLFRRQYITKQKKNILPTETGVSLIDTIQNDLLKSPELTGQWERKLRLIEEGKYKAEDFHEELKHMVVSLVSEVRYGKIPDLPPQCPKCQKAPVLKGKTAFGCKRYKTGCDFLLPFEFEGVKIEEKEMKTLVGGDSLLAQINGHQALIKLNNEFKLQLNESHDEDDENDS